METAEVKYPFELKEKPLISANKFDWDGYLAAQGRGVMDILQRAAKEHPAVQAGDGKPVLKAMKKGDAVVKINAPYRIVMDGKESWAGLDDLRKWEKHGWQQVEHVDY